MTDMSTGVPLASGRSEIFELVLKFILWFMPGWVQVMVLALVVLAVVGSWTLKLKRKIQYRRAVRTGQPVHAAAQYGQGRGADYLGAYAPQENQLQENQPQQNQPQQTPASAGPSGADFPGDHAPVQGQDGAR
ncbi:hypothetical protein [Streptomyces populi]|nr:hypothetical protein [Streptomyces populi]